MIFLVKNAFLKYNDFSYDRTILASEDLKHTKLLIDRVDEIPNLVQLIDNEYKLEKYEQPEKKTRIKRRYVIQRKGIQKTSSHNRFM